VTQGILFDAVRGSAQIAIGNILGSNTFNTFFVLGVSEVISD
jgi:Ca2+/Na+ antiporter